MRPGGNDGTGLEVLVRQLHDAVAFVDLSGRVLLTNRAAELPAQPRSVSMADLGDTFEIFRPDGRPYEVTEWPVLRSIASGEVILDEEFFRVTDDGTRRTFSCNSAPFHDKRGHVAGAVVVLREITFRRNAQEQLAYHASLLENVEDGVIATDAQDFRITAWNRGAERLYGYAAGEVLGRPAREVATFPGDQARVQLERELEASGRTRIEFTARRKDGSMIEVELIAFAVTDEQGRVSGYLGIHRDITLRQHAASALEMRARQQALVADLTLRNLADGDVRGLMDDAVTLIARTLELPLSSVAELLPGADALSWRAAFGWSEEAIAQAAPASARSLVGYTLLADRPVVSDDVLADERFQLSPFFAEQKPVGAIAVVIPGAKQRFGVLVAASRQRRVFSAEDVDFMQAVANVIGVAVERARMTERIEQVRERERRRIARELHDAGLRELTEALGLATIARSSSSDQGDAHRWAALTALLQRVGQQLHSAIYDLRLGSNEALPFADLLDDMVEIQSQLAPECEVRLDGKASLPRGSLGHQGTEVLRIVREAIINACRHSRATFVRVSADRSTADCMRLDVSDDGEWPGREAAISGRLTAGITGMFERADELRAQLRIEPGPGAGTRVSLELSLTGAAPAA